MAAVAAAVVLAVLGVEVVLAVPAAEVDAVVVDDAAEVEGAADADLPATTELSKISVLPSPLLNFWRGSFFFVETYKTKGFT